MKPRLYQNVSASKRIDAWRAKYGLAIGDFTLGTTTTGTNDSGGSGTTTTASSSTTAHRSLRTSSLVTAYNTSNLGSREQEQVTACNANNNIITTSSTSTSSAATQSNFYNSRDTRSGMLLGPQQVGQPGPTTSTSMNTSSKTAGTSQNTATQKQSLAHKTACLTHMLGAVPVQRKRPMSAHVYTTTGNNYQHTTADNMATVNSLNNNNNSVCVHARQQSTRHNKYGIKDKNDNIMVLTKDTIITPTAGAGGEETRKSLDIVQDDKIISSVFSGIKANSHNTSSVRGQQVQLNPLQLQSSERIMMRRPMSAQPRLRSVSALTTSSQGDTTTAGTIVGGQQLPQPPPVVVQKFPISKDGSQTRASGCCLETELVLETELEKVALGPPLVRYGTHSRGSGVSKEQPVSAERERDNSHRKTTRKATTGATTENAVSAATSAVFVPSATSDGQDVVAAPLSRTTTTEAATTENYHGQQVPHTNNNQLSHLQLQQNTAVFGSLKTNSKNVSSRSASSEDYNSGCHHDPQHASSSSSKPCQQQTLSTTRNSTNNAQSSSRLQSANNNSHNNNNNIQIHNAVTSLNQQQQGSQKQQQSHSINTFDNNSLMTMSMGGTISVVDEQFGIGVVGGQSSSQSAGQSESVPVFLEILILNRRM